MRCHVTCHVAMQVVRSLPIRSRCLAMRTGKAYDTSTAARSDQRQRQLVHRFELPAKAKNASKSLFFRCAQPEAEGSLEYSFVESPNSGGAWSTCWPLGWQRIQCPGVSVRRLADGRRV